jgi:alkylation response protein AidB-like acyl-CoA dehydrogenase
MWTYQPPLRDIHFVLNEWLDARSVWQGIAEFADFDTDTVQQIVEGAAQFAAQVLAPTNSGGDLTGCRYENGVVTTPNGYREAYSAYVEGGWSSLGCHPEDGGQGLPHVINAAVFEMLVAANHAWSMYPGLVYGAYECIRTHAAAELKQRYLPKLASGEWLATMCLTESHAGSDLGLLRTRAEPSTEGSFRLNGTKIFISGGEHDLTENIVHLVLARLPEAPSGTKGISLFLVPKFLPDGTRNSVRCDGIEKKMGIKGSATCVMTFDQAQGWIIGEPNRGLAAMFVMMNSARLHVGLQGLGHTEAAYQNALQYAAERVQMRAPAASRANRAADPIIMHPAVRRTLLELRTYAQGQRAMAYWVANLLDLAEHAAEAERRDHCARLTALLTPVAKAFFTENGFLQASAALQVFGGHGYIHDNAIEQTVRDSRIAMLYEGTNEIQAIDLLVRKVIGDNGATLRLLLDELMAESGACERAVGASEFGRRLAEALNDVVSAAEALCADSKHDLELPYRAASDFMRALGLLLLGFVWARAARIALPRAANDAFYRDKVTSAEYCFDFVLPGLQHRLRLIHTARKPLAQIGPDSR